MANWRLQTNSWNWKNHPARCVSTARSQAQWRHHGKYIKWTPLNYHRQNTIQHERTLLNISWRCFHWLSHTKRYHRWNRVTTLQTAKNPWLFQTKLKTTYWTNAHSLIQNLLVTKFRSHFSNWLKSTQNAEHQICKKNSSMNKVQVSYMLKISCDCMSMTSNFCDQDTAKLSQSNIPDYINSLTFRWLFSFSLTFAEFPDISRFPKIPEKW